MAIETLFLMIFNLRLQIVLMFLIAWVVYFLASVSFILQQNTVSEKE